MPFTTATNKTKTGRGAIGITLYIPDPTKPEESQYGRVSVQVHYSDGSIEEKIYDLLARLQDDSAGQTHAVNLLSLRDYIIGRVEDEVINL